MKHRTGRDIILKARQHGFSTLIQALIYQSAITRTTTAITLSHESETTQKLRRMSVRFWENTKPKPPRKYANAKLTTYPDYDSEVTVATAGNVMTGRGGTYSFIHGSEAAFWKDAEALMAGMGEGGDPEDIILESTANGATGYFYGLCIEAMSGNSSWTLHFYPWWWEDGNTLPLDDEETLEYTGDELKCIERAKDGGFELSPEQIKWRRKKKRDLKQLFAQEYPEDVMECFLTSGRSYFGDLSHVWTAPKDAKYDHAHRYAGGLDFGQTTDFTVVPVFDIDDRCKVDKLRINRMPWADMRRQIKLIYHKWHLTSILAEENSIGSVNIEELRKDELLEDTTLTPDTPGIEERDGEMRLLGINVRAFTTTKTSKEEIMARLHDALSIEGGWRLIDDSNTKLEYNSFVATKIPTGWKLAADGDNHDDEVVGDALAVKSAMMPSPADLIGFA